MPETPFEFMYVYEHDVLCGLEEEDQEKIRNEMNKAITAVSWEDEDGRQHDA